MYRCESWTIKKAESQRTDAFELWWWRRLLRVPWTAGRSNQSILKEISPEYSLEGLVLKLKLQYFGHLIWRADSFQKTLMLGKIAGRSKRGRQRMGWLDGITDLMDMSLSKLRGVGDGQGGLAFCSPWGCKESDMTEWLNWTELSTALTIRAKPRFSYSQSLPSGSFHKPLVHLHQRTDRMKAIITETNQTDHMDHSLVLLNKTISRAV